MIVEDLVKVPGVFSSMPILLPAFLHSFTFHLDIDSTMHISTAICGFLRLLRIFASFALVCEPCNHAPFCHHDPIMAGNTYRNTTLLAVVAYSRYHHIGCESMRVVGYNLRSVIHLTAHLAMFVPLPLYRVWLTTDLHQVVATTSAVYGRFVASIVTWNQSSGM